VNDPNEKTGNIIRQLIKREIEKINGCIKEDRKKMGQFYYFHLDGEQDEIKIAKELQSIYEDMKKRFEGNWGLVWLISKPLILKTTLPPSEVI
jgi:hypothetical protein